jgi:histidine phosphotransferase ChpT
MSGTDGALRLIELTSARLRHDISGSPERAFPATAGGAPGDPDGADNAPSAVQASTTQRALMTRRALHHAAWGPEGEPLSVAKIQLLAGGLQERAAVDVAALDQTTVFPASTSRIVLNLLLLAADSLPSGGTVALAGARHDLFVRIAGPAAAWPAGMAVCFADETEARSALTEGRSLQMALTALLAHAAGTRLSLVLSPTAQDRPAILRLGG